ncbi:MAG: GLUG motif-containing protein, partial [Christensenellales bacterium]
NAGISSQPISVRVFKNISQQDINVSFSDGRDSLTLATSVIPAETIKMLTFAVDTQEDYVINELAVVSSVNDIVEVEKIDDNNFKVTGINAGKGTLKFNLVLKDSDKLYENATVEISVPVEVKQYATKIKLNGNENVVDNLFLYDTYQNQLGEKFVVNVGEENAQDKRFVISLSDDDQQKITIVDSGNNPIKPYVKDGDYDVLNSNTTLFIRIKEGYTQESTATIKFLTYDSLNLLCEPTSNKINASLKHGVKSLDVQPVALNQYADGTYLLGLNTNLQYNNYVVSVIVPKDQFTSYIKTRISSSCIDINEKISFADATKNADNTIFNFELKGLSEDICTIEFFAENGFSTLINVRVYNKVNAFQVTSQTVNQNSSIGEVKYENQVCTFNGTPVNRNSLSKIAIALNGEVKLGIIPIYFDGEKAYNIQTKNIIKCDVSKNEYVEFLANNTLVAKKLTPTDTSNPTITISLTVFCETGELELAEQSIEIEVFYEIKKVFLDENHIKLYTKDDLAPADKEFATHEFKLKYNNGTEDVEITDEATWLIGGQDKQSIVQNGSTVTATSLSGGREFGLATITAFYEKYGRTYIVQANIEIEKAYRVTDIYNLTYTKDGKTNAIVPQNVLISEKYNDETGDYDQTFEKNVYYIYLDSRNNISVGSTFVLGQTIAPSNAYNKTLIYSTKNAVEEENVPVLLIDENGKVTINRTGGTAYIYISAKDSLNDAEVYEIERKIFVRIADGKSSDTALEIANEYDFVAINNNKESLSKFYRVVKDINLSGLTSNSAWTPIGIIDGEFYEFSGNIDGKIISEGETYICNIFGFNINLQSGADNVLSGLFATLSSNAVIKNLNIQISKVDIDCTSNDNQSQFTFGGLTAINKGKIKDVSVDIVDTNSQICECAYISNIGGLVGINEGQIYQCYVSGNLNHIKQNSLNTSKTNIGGLVGQNTNQIDGNSKLVNDNTFADDYTSLINLNSAYINANSVKTYNEIKGDICVGGVVGLNVADATLKNCSFDGWVKAINNVGGIVGLNESAIENCFASGHVNGFNNVGGIAGYSLASINFCAVNMFDDFESTYDGEITPNIIARFDNVGGLVGSLTGATLSNGYVKSYYVRSSANYLGDIYVLAGAKAQNVGGLVGYAKNSTIQTSFVQANINTAELNAYVGGFVGGAEETTILNCYTMGHIVLKDKNNSFAGKFIGLLNSNGTIANSYSTIVDADINAGSTSTSYFVGAIGGGSLTVASSYHLSGGTTDAGNVALKNDTDNGRTKTSDVLKNIGTYTGWSIGTDLTGNITWYINAGNNDGYPMLVIGNKKLSVEAPNEIVATLNNGNGYMKKLDDTSAIIWRGSKSSSVYLINSTYGLFSEISVNPTDAGMAYNITSSNDSVLSITGRNKDRIIPLSNGIATLTITSRLNNTVTKTITIYVVNKIENFDVDQTNITSLVNQKQTVGVSAQNYSNYRLKIKVSGGNNQYLNINNLTIDANGIIDIPYSSNLYIYSTKSIVDIAFEIQITPYIIVKTLDDTEEKIETTSKTIKYCSYYGIKDFNCSLTNINITQNDSARLVFTATGDDLRVATNELPKLTFAGNEEIIVNQSNQTILNFVLAKATAYDYAGNLTTDYTKEISKIVYEYVVRVNADAFNTAIAKKDKLEIDITANISLTENSTTEGTTASAQAKFVISKQQLKNIGVDFFANSQKIINDAGQEEYTVVETSSHQIIAGKTGLLKVSLYPNTADVNEVRVYAVGGTHNISMYQLLKQPIYDSIDTAKINSYSYVERKPYAISLVDKNGLALWNESNFDDGTSTFDGNFYVGFIIPSSVAAGTAYTVYVEAYLKDGRTLVQSYDLYSDIPSEVSVSYNFNNTQILTDTAYIAYGVEYTLTVEVAKLAVEEMPDGSGIKDLDIISEYSNFEYDKDNSVLNSGSYSYLRYKFKVDDKTISNFNFKVKLQKTVNGLLTTFTSNNIAFNLKDFVVTSIDIVTDEYNSDTLSLATNNSTELKVVLTAEYDGSDTIKTSIDELAIDISKTLSSWQAKKSVTGAFEQLTLETYPNFKISQDTGTGFYKIQPINASSGEEIYVAITLDYSSDTFGSVDLANDKAGFAGSKQTLISKVTTNFFRDVSATNSIPVGDLKDESQTTNNQYGNQEDTVVGEINFVDIQNGSSENKLYYRLKENLTLTDYTPLDLSYVELDGNGYTITIESFSDEAIASGNLGLFNTIDENCLLQNLKVNYSNLTIDYTKQDAEPSLINFGGLVATNNGIVYNCQAKGQVEVVTQSSATSGTEVYVGGISAVNNNAISFSQSRLKISVNRGYVGGFVAQNSGKISNSKVVFSGTNCISNTSTTELLNLVGGFVARNSGKIYGSYIAGTNLSGSRYTDQISSYTPIGAFVNKNSGEIANSFANITVICQTRSSGFVYDNAGTIYSCYSASKMQTNSSAHNPFTGVNETGVNNSGTITDCYYLTDTFGSTSQEPATKLNTLTDEQQFAEFVFADAGLLNGTWYMTSYGPTLVDADLNIVSEQTYMGLAPDATTGKQTYSWSFNENTPISGKTFTDSNNITYYNLRTITNFQQFNDFIKADSSTGSADGTLSDHFVLLCDIVCEDYVTPKSAELSFAGKFLGNNMTISNLYLKASNDNKNQYFGLFGELCGAVVKDLTIKAKQATANNISYVGILAGRITDSSNITNISVDGSSVYVQGKYFVGGIAGYMSGSSITKASVSTTVNASYRGNETYAKVFDNISQDGNYEFTYSGIAVGVLTGASSLKDVTVTGNSIAIGYYASACVGLVDSGSTLSLANVQIDPKQYVRAYYVAGGVVAENRGIVDRCSVAHEDNVQMAIDTNNSTANRNLTFFAGSPKIIGGLVGFNNGGTITDSFSKLDVRAETLNTNVAGGLVGTIISGTIQNSFATGSVLSRRVIGGLLGSITTKDSICYNINTSGSTNSAVFEEGQTQIADGTVTIKNVLASNRWLTGSYNDFDIIAAAFQKGLLIGCFNRNTDIQTENCFVNTQVTQNTTKTDINAYLKTNAVLKAFNGDNDITQSIDEINKKIDEQNSTLDEQNKITKITAVDYLTFYLTCGGYTTNFEGISMTGGSDSTQAKPNVDVKTQSNGTYITFYFLNNFDANMNLIASDGKFNAPADVVGIYPTIIKNINL